MIDLRVIGQCCDGIEAIEFYQSLADIVDNKNKESCNMYQRSLNRFKYEVAKGIGEKVKINKAVYKYHNDVITCGHCGFRLSEVVWQYCPNCGTKIMRK